MANITKNGLYLTLASIVMILLINLASAEVSSTTTEATVSSTETPAKFSCQNATAAIVNSTRLLGEWFEIARRPINESGPNKNCYKMDLQSNSTEVNAQVTYSLNPDKLWVNEKTNYTLNYKFEPKSDKNVEGIYNETINGTTTIYKILETDYDSFAFVCGYIIESEISTTTTAPSTTTTSTATSTDKPPTPTSESTTPNPEPANITGAYILVRQRSLNDTFETNLLEKASSNFSDFDHLNTVIQSSKCTNGAATLMPLLAMMMSIILSILMLSP